MCEYTDFCSIHFQDHKIDLGNENDPEIHFYQNINMNCEYYSENNFNSSVKMEGLSVISISSRSLLSNFSKIKDYLQQFMQRFSVTAISETWLSDDKELQDGLEGYEVNKRGSGVALFVRSILQCKLTMR